MKQIRKKTLDKATEYAISQAANSATPLVFDRYEDLVPLCRFGQLGLDCRACTQGPCRINPFDPSNGTSCGRDRENTVASTFLGIVSNGAVVNAAYAGSMSTAAPAIFEGITAANEGSLSPADMYRKAIKVAQAGFGDLAAARPAATTVKEVEAGAGAIKPDSINVLLVGNIAAHQAEMIASQLSANPNVNVVGMCGGEVVGLPIAGNYNSEEALLILAGVDAVVTGKACVSPGFLALAAKQGVPVVPAGQFDAASLLDKADAHYRMNAGRSTATKFPPAKAITGFTAAGFASISADQWSRLAASGINGVALIGGCNNAIATQDASIVRQADECLANGILVIASGCAAAALAKAGYMDPVGVETLAGRSLRPFLAALSEATAMAIPAVIHAGSCWQLPEALKLAQLFATNMKLPLLATMPEISRPAGWSSALAIAASGVPTYVGPVLPLDGGLQAVETLNDLLKGGGGALMGPAQLSSPEAVVGLVRIGGGSIAG